jgi:hypothetical protein
MRRHFLFGSALVLFCWALSTAASAAQPCLFFWNLSNKKHSKSFSWEWINENVVKEIVISGNRDLGVHFDKVTGDNSAYNVTTYYGQGSRIFTDVGNLSLVGHKVLGVFNFDFQFADSRFQDPLASHLSLNYDQNGLRIDAGDINVSLPTGNRFTAFNRQLYGFFGSYHFGSASFSVLESASKSTSQTVSFAGNNSVGPYYLQNSQILPSVEVQVDGKTYQLGVDFDLDQVQGSITFKSLVVPPTSTITVSYQSVGLNSGGGELTAGTLGYDLGKLGGMTLSFARQTDPLASGLTTFTERFQGYGDASLPYQLQYVPLNPQTAIITVDGVIQAINIDYTFSAANPTFLFFNRAVPVTSTITATYNPQPTNTTHGDRAVTGFSYALPLGPKGRDGSLSYSTALGRLSNNVTPLHGLARSIDGQYKFKNYKLNVSFDNIPSGFVGINTTGFLRNEVGTNLSLENRLKRFAYGVTESNSAVSNQLTDANGHLTFQPSRSTSLGGFLDYGDSSSELWKLEQSHLAGYSSSGTTRADQTSLSYSRHFGQIEPKLVLSRTEGLGPITDSTGNTTEGHIALNSIGLNTTYEIKNLWIFSSQTTLDQIKTNTTSGQGEDVDFSAAYRGLKKVILTSRYTYSNSGSLASLGQFQNGSGQGYNGNGFSNGIGGNLSTNSFNTSASNLRRLSSNVLWTPSELTTINLNVSSTGQSGDITTNSNNTTIQLTGDFRLNQRSNLDLAITQYTTDFADASVSGSRSTLLSAGFDSTPKGPWSYRVSLSDLMATGGTQAQDSLNVNLSLRHKLHKNQTLGLEVVLGRISNYLPQDQTTFRASYTYHLFRSMDFITAYNIRSIVNKDASVMSGAYDARGLDFELRFNFAN